MGKAKSARSPSLHSTVLLIVLCCLLAWLSGRDSFSTAAAQSNESPDALSWEAAEAAADKLHRVRDGSLSSNPSREVRLSEAEANSYLRYYIASSFPAGLSDVRLKFQPDRPQGWAEVDFDRLKESFRSPPNPLVDYLLQGVHILGVEGTFHSSEGMGQFHLETVTLDGVALPRVVVDFLIEHYLQARYPSAAINQPFRLPYSLEKVTVGAGSCFLTGQAAGS